jgi:hypothetical protein
MPVVLVVDDGVVRRQHLQLFGLEVVLQICKSSIVMKMSQAKAYLRSLVGAGDGGVFGCCLPS